MKQVLKKNTIGFHIIICITFLVLPFLITPEHREEFGNKIGDYLIIRKEVINIILLLFFYVNYYFLLPNYFFKKKFVSFSIAILIFITGMILSYIILNQTASSKHNFAFFIDLQISFFLFVCVFFITYSIRVNEKLKIVETEKKDSQLSILKNQINPHFLFNTLNSIYTLSIKKSDETATAIVKLSGMMRYSITEVEQSLVLLEKEIQFISNYIALQKIRLGTTCTIEFESKNDSEFEKIIPLVFIAFVENAFKYGVSTDEHSLIQLSIINTDGQLEFKIKNKKLNKTQDINSTEIGISNTKKRLELLYPKKFELNIIETNNDFSVNLKLNLR